MIPADPTPGLREPSSLPLLLFDGDCGFCRYWVDRWRILTRGAVRFAPAQQEAARFPQISEQAWKRAVQLVTPEGMVYSAAEAVFHLLAFVSGFRWMLLLYDHVPGVRPLSEALYRLIANHRDFFFKLTRLGWGADPAPSTYIISRWLFLRLLGLVYLIAFLSLRVQVLGLIGARGILPAADFLRAVQQELGAQSYHLVPTLAWFSATDASLKLLCSAGAFLGLLIMCGVFTGPALVLAWLFYLSLMGVGQDFLGFQWDTLLLEAGFFAIFLASWRPLDPPWRPAASAPSNALIWLGRWLLFRLMFLSGAVKLLSGDATWRGLTALEFHYWTQPLPTPVAWYAAQLPAWFQKFSVVSVFALELAVPFLIFTPRRIRRVGAGLIAGFEVLIALTGNYCFFNLLTIVLCVLLLDDGFLRRFLPRWLTDRLAPPAGESKRFAAILAPVRNAIYATLIVVILVISGSEMMVAFGHVDAVPNIVRQLDDWQEPYHLVSSYGLFAVMTTSRVEIVVEGSNDGQTWQPYEFRYKPGDLARRPPWVAPHQPRLDWQMWFAALGTYEGNRWFTNFMIRLLQGSPDVEALLATNPFPDAPPAHIRAVAYDYRFTDFKTRRATGNWWERQRRPELYFPEVSLKPR